MASPFLRRATDDLVVDVGDVADIGDVVAAVAQPALHQVEGHQHAAVADVAVVVNGDAADIHAHPRRARWVRTPRPFPVRELWMVSIVKFYWSPAHAKRASRLRAAPAGMAFSSGPSSGPASLPVRAARNGLNSRRALEAGGGFRRGDDRREIVVRRGSRGGSRAEQFAIGCTYRSLCFPIGLGPGAECHIYPGQCIDGKENQVGQYGSDECVTGRRIPPLQAGTNPAMRAPHPRDCRCTASFCQPSSCAGIEMRWRALQVTHVECRGHFSKREQFHGAAWNDQGGTDGSPTRAADSPVRATAAGTLRHCAWTAGAIGTGQQREMSIARRRQLQRLQDQQLARRIAQVIIAAQQLG